MHQYLLWIYINLKRNTFLILSNLQTNLFRIDLPKHGPTYGGEWLIHGSKYRKDN